MATGLGTGSYDCTITDTNGCTGVVSASVTNPNAPTATMTDSTDVLCNGDCTGDATVTATGGTPGYTYLWDDPNTQTDVQATGLCVGTYSVTVTDANNCQSTATLTITEPPALTGTITSTPTSNASECDGTAMVNATGGVIQYTYLWDANANNQTNQMADSLCAGNYCVTVTDANNCTWDTCIDVAVGLEEHSILQKLSIYPNPNNGEFTLEIISKVKENIEIRIVNVLGQEVFTQQLQKFTGTYKKELNLKAHAGLYSLQVNTERGILNRKIIIMNFRKVMQLNKNPSE